VRQARLLAVPACCCRLVCRYYDSPYYAASSACIAATVGSHHHHHHDIQAHVASTDAVAPRWSAASKTLSKDVWPEKMKHQKVCCRSRARVLVTVRSTSAVGRFGLGDGCLDLVRSIRQVRSMSWDDYELPDYFLSP
jgi:hypothetical protein